MQVHKSEFRSALTCARTVYANEGLSAFYVSYPTTLTMTVPFTAVQFTVYEQLKAFLNPHGSYSPSTHIVAGGLAGAVAGAVTTPLDVAKTLLQTRGTSHDQEIRHCKGLFDAARRGMRERSKALEDIAFFLVGRIEGGRERARAVSAVVACARTRSRCFFY